MNQCHTKLMVVLSELNCDQVLRILCQLLRRFLPSAKEGAEGDNRAWPAYESYYRALPY